MKILSKSSACINERTKNIPHELKDLALWCCYKLEPNPGSKPKKVPYNPNTNQRAKINDPQTLCPFEDAVAGVESGRYDGINYAFGYGDTIGIDLDGVINAETGELSEVVAEVCRRFEEAGAYVEMSPSGTGLRVICRGVLPRFGKGSGDFKGFEVYGPGVGGLHFLSITGNVINAVDALPECQGALDWFYVKFIERPEKPAPVTAQADNLEPSPELDDDELLKLARRAKNGSDFTRLFDDGITDDHSSADLRLCAMLGFFTQNAAQLDRLFRESALMRDKWERLDYRESTIRKALEGLTATYQPSEEARQVTLGSYGITEREGARRFLDSEAATNFKILRQARTPKVMRFNGAVWVEDCHGHELSNAVTGVAKIIMKEMTTEANTTRRDQLYALAKRLETRRGLQDVTALVIMSLSEFLPEEANNHDNWLPVGNGVILLGSGTLAAQSADLLWTRQSSIPFDKAAQCPTWLKFLREFCCENNELERFLQTWFGYCASGFTIEHRMAVFYGGGCNGKSVLLNTVGFVLDGFAGITPADTLLQRKSEHSNDLAALDGLRFVVASETDDGHALAEGRIKAITGGDRVVCRRLFEEFREYTPRFKLNLATNSKPRVNGTDMGIWRRLLLIPCRAVIENPDKNLSEKLKAEAPGVLNWMIAGYQIWQREGLNVPECVAKATDEYRRDSDQVGRFLDDVCTPWRGQSTQSSEVYKSYTAWCVEQGHHAFAQNKFSSKMAEKGYAVERKFNGRFFPASLTLRIP